MPLLSISVNGNSARRASAFFKQGGVVLTDVWGGQNNTWWRITDASLLKRINQLRSSSPSAVLTDGVWAEIAKMDPATVAEPYQANGTRPSTGMPTFQGGFKNQMAGKGAAHGTPDEKPAKVDLRGLVERWFKFFSEFRFKPQPRFMNSVARQPNAEAVAAYVVGYFELTNNSFADDVREKVKSREFSEIVADTLTIKPDRKVNQRLEVYYGEPGGGKTTTAICNNPDAKVVLCHASMTPDELFRGFDFEEEKDKDGNVTGSHPVFKGCALREAMEQGKVVILDEINLLSEDCRRALQAVTDAKAEVTINNDTIKIKDGFKVIGTMNLNVGDMVFPLPEALVDRAEVIKRFEMDPALVAQLAF